MMSMGSTLPSSKRTLPPCNSEMFGFHVISPWAIRLRKSAEMVGWASPILWSGSGSP